MSRPARVNRFIEAPAAAGGEGIAAFARTLSERRQDTRRSPRLDRSLAANPPRPERGNWFPRRWPFLLLCMLAIVGVARLGAGAWPHMPILPLLAASVILSGCARFTFDWVRGRSFAAHLLAASAVVALPLFLYGLGMALWALRGGLAWDMVLAALICVGGIASAYLRRQPAMIFAGQFAIWSAPVAALQSLAGLLTMLVALVVAILISREQLREEHEEVVRQQMRDRMQTRARDILADYEETQLGWFWETDRRSLLTYISPPIARALGHEPEELVGSPLVQLFHLADSGQDGERTLLFHLTARSAFNEVSVRAAIREEERWWSISGRPIYDAFHNFVGFRGSGTDLTEKKRSREDASRLAHYDSLTDLANRLQMSRTLERILAAPRESERQCTVLLLDLDRFKRVNDTMGHPAGDALLKQVAQRLLGTVGQMGQVGRLGGDEFEVILAGEVERRAVGHLCEAIIHALSQPYVIDGQRVVIGASVGVAVSPDDGKTSEELIRNADLALYAAKDGGRGRYHFYAEDLHAQAEERAKLERDLRDAISHGELELYYQPVIATSSERISGFEALLRWRHPDRGWVPTNHFVEAAEESGLIAQIGEWALRQACQDLARWPEEVRVAVNVSPLQFANPQLPAIVAQAIASAGIEPSRLELEITESVFLTDDEGTEAMFAALKRIGVRMALDDFGTGYSSLGYLKKAPFDKIKIDQSFVRGATQPGSRNGAIIASITGLAHALGMDTTAEGVETLDELDLVRMHGCSHVQGFIYERPLSAEDAAARLASGLTAVARGPRSARAPRQTMLRKVLLDHHGHLYNVTVRNISVSGAMVEGLWNVPVGTVFRMHLSERHELEAVTRWCSANRAGLEFAEPLERDASGRLAAVQERAPDLSGKAAVALRG
ncbi:diguanylate cyclase [Altererythrobacter sp. B11]|uniref:EAL domain-containing protein n=1 Tax=Altererythrobacter sp. B11 TaxID=2060312 RepID=UPI000DC726E6|nr:EAL domain-containing protein [Altererythrobacter sp. B11]BBC72450.1 diguanylate cyclase [Altererythrobacter sp. B11]